MNRIYFDNAATSPVRAEVADYMSDVIRSCFGNPSSIHDEGRRARTLIEEARKSVARILDVPPGTIFFTSGGTEADNHAIRGSIENLGVKHIITSPIEHHAVEATTEELHKKGKCELSHVKVLYNGHIDLDSLEKLLSKNENVLVSLMHANNEIGNLLDVEAVSLLCKKYNAFFHSDTVQTIGHYEVFPQKLGIDFLACSAHKFYGPKGVGFIYINNEKHLNPMITGGSQERNMRAGTENIYGICGLAKALEFSMNNLNNEQQHIKHLKTYMMSELENKIKGISFNGDAKGNSLYTVLNVHFPPSPVSEMLLFKLDIAGISASGGSACSSGSDAGSHVLKAMQIDQECASVRFSFSHLNTTEEIDRTVGMLQEIYS